jgi:hypothetical protein
MTIDEKVKDVLNDANRIEATKNSIEYVENLKKAGLLKPETYSISSGIQSGSKDISKVYNEFQNFFP